MNKYNKGKIYKITSPNTDDVYYGSTILSLNQRFWTHKSCNSKIIIEAGDAKIELVEKYPCESKQELLWRERYYIENFDCINKMKPIQTKEEKRENDREYYKKNKEYQKEYKKEYYEKNKERVNLYNSKNREKRRLYSIEYNKIKLSCRVCKCEMGKNAFSRHKKSKKHLENIKMKQDLKNTEI